MRIYEAPIACVSSLHVLNKVCRHQKCTNLYAVYYTINLLLTVSTQSPSSENLHLPTHSTVQSPSFEANWFAASQEIPRISRNPKVHYRTHKCPPPVSILGQSTYPHPTSWRAILILSTHLHLGLPSGLLPSGFPTKTLYTPLSSPIRATCPAHYFIFVVPCVVTLG